MICVFLLCSGTLAQTGKVYPTVTKRPDLLTNSPVKQISGDLFQIGLAKISKKDRTVSFPAAINMSSNLIEFVCDGGDTKLHESLFRTETSPLHIHLGALLLSNVATNAAAVSTNGQPVSITILWNDGKEKTDLEELIVKRNLKDKSETTMPKGNWVYTGWNSYGGRMPSEISGVVIALLSDSTALVNCKDQDHENDEIWFINQTKTPRVGTPVEVVFNFSKNSNSKTEPKNPEASAQK